MAYELVLDKLYPESRRYSGTCDKLEADMVAPSAMSFITPIVVKVVEWFPPKGEQKLIRIRIWQDKTPFWTDRYKLEVIAHGSPQLPWPQIVVALAAIAGLAVITWSISHIDWKAPGIPLLGIGLILLALAIFKGRRRT